MSRAFAPASFATAACSTASLIPSHTTEEMTGQIPSVAVAVMRVTSARSRGVRENTSPVCPLVINATTPSWRPSQAAKRASSASSIA